MVSFREFVYLPFVVESSLTHVPYLDKIQIVEQMLKFKYQYHYQGFVYKSNAVCVWKRTHRFYHWLKKMQSILVIWLRIWQNEVDHLTTAILWDVYKGWLRNINQSGCVEFTVFAYSIYLDNLTKHSEYSWRCYYQDGRRFFLPNHPIQRTQFVVI